MFSQIRFCPLSYKKRLSMLKFCKQLQVTFDYFLWHKFQAIDLYDTGTMLIIVIDV